MFAIEQIEIHNIGPINNLILKFDNNFNIICGENGIGKTTILDCLTQMFSSNNFGVKRKSNSESGSWTVRINNNNNTIYKTTDISLFHPHENSTHSYGLYELANKIVVFRTHRDFTYQKIDSIKSDQSISIIALGTQTITGSPISGTKNWFINRYLFTAQPDALDINQIKNFDLAKRCFAILDSNIKFKKVNPATLDIILTTKNGDIYFEYLSSGFKSSLAILLGVIEAIEIRNRENPISAEDFEGILFIDEIDLHLHPEWQAKIYTAIKSIFKKSQIFTSTHSPHIIQVAQPNEVIPLIKNEHGEVINNNVASNEFGFQGWTVEEILRDVMGMTETRTDTYLNAISKFNSAIEEEEVELAYKQYNILDKMLHPESSLRKILKIQLAGFSDND